MDVFVALLCILVILWLAWRKQKTSTFKKLGFPGPEPNLIFGNLLELYKKGPLQCHKEWVEKYGRILGYYYGMKPVLLVTDPHILKNVFIKDFSNFTDREMAGSMNSSIDAMLEILQKKVNKGEDVEMFDIYQRLTMDVYHSNSIRCEDGCAN